MAWKQGPLPPDTWGWGAVTKAGEGDQGFYFADFLGNSVLAVTFDTPGGAPLKAHEVGMYDNSIELPPGATKRA